MKVIKVASTIPTYCGKLNTAVYLNNKQRRNDEMIK